MLARSCIVITISLLQGLFSSSQAQSFKRLYQGDQLPMENIAFNNVRNYSKKNVNLADFKGKYIIFDFWTKGCSACIAAFPKMQELQEIFKDQLQILLITKNTEEELATLLKNNLKVRNARLPMIIGDSILSKICFPHTSVPFHVWIDKDGKVAATTYSGETTEKNIRGWLSGNKLSLLERREIFDKTLLQKVNDKKVSLMDIVHPDLGGNLLYFSTIQLSREKNRVPSNNPEPFNLRQNIYYSLFRSYLHGDVKTGFTSLSNQLFLDKNDTPKGFRIINESLIRMYQKAYDARDCEKVLPEGDARDLVEDVTNTTDMKRHLVNNFYCYESNIPGFTMEKGKALFRKDLERAFGLTATIEYMPVKHLVLQRTDSTEVLLWKEKDKRKREKYSFDKEGTYKMADGRIMLKNTSLERVKLFLYLSNMGVDDPPIIDGTGFTKSELKYTIQDGIFNLKLSATGENLSILRKELARLGLDLVEETRIVKTLVLRKIIQ